MDGNNPSYRYPRVQTPFIACPIPESWLRHAAEAGHAALKTALALLMLYNRAHAIAFAAGGEDLAGRMDLDRRTIVAGLSQLEAAGLISISRSPGHKNWIRLCRFECPVTAAKTVVP
jgi:predicted transcriptional regulator